MARRPLLDSAKEYARGMAGGLLFSLPLLYTMEVWWTGVMVDPFRLLAYVFAGFVLLLGYNYYAGIRKDVTFMDQVMDTVEELGLGMMVAALVLWLLGRLTPEMSLREVIGQVVVEAVVVAIGISVGKKQLGGGGGKQDQGKQDQGKQGGGREPSVGGQLVIGLCGAVLISSNVAPTEEIVVIAVAASPWKILALALLSIAGGGGILYYSNFAGMQHAVQPEGLPDIFLGTALMYTSALSVSTFLLWFFGRFNGVSPEMALAEIVVLGVTAVLGASAGRLLLQV